MIWNDDFEFEFLWNEFPFDVRFHAKGYYDRGNFNYPPEADNDITAVKVYFKNGTICQNDRNWKRLDVFMPGFTDELLTACDKHVCEVIP